MFLAMHNFKKCSFLILLACESGRERRCISRNEYIFPEVRSNNNLLHLYSTFLDTQSALHSEGYLLIHRQCAASTWTM